MRRGFHPGLITFSLLIAFGIGGFSGCGRQNSGPMRYPVQGTVTFEGKPIATGDIVFSPLDPAVSPEAAKIVDGRFNLSAKAGENRVEIQAAHQKTDQKNVDESGKPVPVFESYIPAAYNKDSKLNAVVKPQNQGNVFDFTLNKEGT